MLGREAAQPRAHDRRECELGRADASLPETHNSVALVLLVMEDDLPLSLELLQALHQLDHFF